MAVAAGGRTTLYNLYFFMLFKGDLELLVTVTICARLWVNRERFMMSANEGAASSQPSIKKPTPPTPSRKTEATLGQGPVACRFSTNSKEKSFGVLP